MIDNNITLNITLTLDEYDSMRDDLIYRYIALCRILRLCKNDAYISRDKILDILEDTNIGEFMDYIDDIRASDKE